MNEPNSKPILTPDQKQEILLGRKYAILKIIDEMTETLPPTVKMLLQMNRSTFQQYIDNMTYEQTEEVLDKVQSVIDEIRG